MGLIEGNLYSIISYYTPNKGQTKCFQVLLKTLLPLVEGKVIFGGDSNVAFNQGLDKSRPHKAQLMHPTKASSNIARTLYKHGLVNIWRELNPSKRDYTHFSAPHHSYARIDHILLPPNLIPLSRKVTIIDTAWSDPWSASHCVMSSLERRMHWRLNESILSDPINTADIEQSLLNNVENISPEVLWAAQQSSYQRENNWHCIPSQKRLSDIENLETNSRP